VVGWTFNTNNLKHIKMLTWIISVVRLHHKVYYKQRWNESYATCRMFLSDREHVYILCNYGGVLFPFTEMRMFFVYIPIYKITSIAWSHPVVITLPGNERVPGCGSLAPCMTSPDLRHREMSKPMRGVLLYVYIGVVLLLYF